MPLRDLDRPAVSPEKDVPQLRRYVEQLRGVSVLDGQLLDFEIAPGSLFASVRHSLKRSYSGAIVVGQGVNGGIVFVLDPTSAAADVDVTTHVRVGISDTPSGAPLRARIWCF